MSVDVLVHIWSRRRFQNPDQKHPHCAIWTYVTLTAASNHEIISVCLFLIIAAVGAPFLSHTETLGKVLYPLRQICCIRENLINCRSGDSKQVSRLTGTPLDIF